MPSKITLGKFKHPALNQNAEIATTDFKNTLIFGNVQTKARDLIKNLAVDLMRSQAGMILFDFDNQFDDQFITSLPQNLQDKIAVFDPLYNVGIPGLNLLDVGLNQSASPDQMTLIVSKFWAILDEIYDLKTSGGPIFETYFKNTLKLAMVHVESGSTLQIFNHILRDSDFRSFKLCMCDDQNVLNFWNDQDLKPENEAFLTNTVPYITSKLSPFLDNSIVSNVVSQQNSSFNFRELLQNGKVLIINLDQNKIGQEAQKVSGMLLLAKFELDLLNFNFTQELEKPTIIIPNLQQFMSDYLMNFLDKNSEKTRFIGGASSEKSLNIKTKDYYKLIAEYFPNLIQFRSAVNPKTFHLENGQALFNLSIDQENTAPIILEITKALFDANQNHSQNPNFYLKGGLTEVEIKNLVKTQAAYLFS